MMSADENVHSRVDYEALTKAKVKNTGNVWVRVAIYLFKGSLETL